MSKENTNISNVIVDRADKVLAYSLPMLGLGIILNHKYNIVKNISNTVSSAYNNVANVAGNINESLKDMQDKSKQVVEHTYDYLYERYTHEGLGFKNKYGSDQDIQSNNPQEELIIYKHKIFDSFDIDDKKKLHLDALALSQDIYVINGHSNNYYETYSKTLCEKTELNQANSKCNGWYLLCPNPSYRPNSHPNEIDNFVDRINKLKYNDYIAEKSSGFGSAVFYTKYKDGQYVIAYVTEGSNMEANDWINNAQQGAGFISEQYELSKKNAIFIMRAFEDIFGKNSVHKLYFFGHSLGGGLANLNSLVTGYPSITFNAASLNSDYKVQYKKNYKKRLMVGEYVEGEILSLRATNVVGLEKDGDRYRTKLRIASRFNNGLPPFVVGSAGAGVAVGTIVGGMGGVWGMVGGAALGDMVSKHMLEPLCKERGLRKTTYNKSETL